MAESPNSSLFEVVGCLQSRLLRSTMPQKLLKHLKRLSELPITLDILTGTGVGKTVNALRKYERVAVVARGLVAQWKKLVPVLQTATQNKEPEAPEPKRRFSRKRTRDTLTKEREVEEHDGESRKASCSLPPDSLEGRKKKYQKLDKNLKDSLRDSKVEKKEGKIRDGKTSGNQFSILHSSNCELSGKSHVLSPLASTNPQQVSMDCDKPQEKKADQLRSPQKPHKRQNQVTQDKEGDNPKRCLVKREVKVAFHRHHHQNKGHKSSEKNKAPLSEKGKGRCFELSQEKLPQVASREEGSNPSSKTNLKEKQAAPSTPKREKKTAGSSGKKTSGPPSEMTSGKSIHKPKDKDAQKTEAEKSKLSVESLHGEMQKGELTSEIQDKECSNKLKTQKRTEALNANKTPSKIQGTQESEGDDSFEQHSMSFESYLLYDQPKKRRVGKTPTSGSRKESHPKLKSVKPEMKSHSAVKKLPMENCSQSKKHQARADSANPQKSSDGSPALPVICHPLLSMQTVYHPLSSGELNSAFCLKKQVPSTSQENRVAELPMSRVNSKVEVYSGSRNSYIPKMLSLYEWCIKVLGKNIDLIYEVGQVPYNVLTPVLEKCSPEQLYRIEEYNPIFLEDSDNLWKVHCSQDFRKELPEEFESWREMYLRLHDAQEERLCHLNNSIRLAHAKRPKGRQTKMLFINPASRSPYDVPETQMLGVGGTVVLKNASIKTNQYTLSSRNSPASGFQEKEPCDGPSTSSAHLAPSGSHASSEHSKKTSGKKVAPKMAKPKKTFKNRFARS
uniref:TFIIS N-terminal domain-containing protein n=1 Tax=Vombatus ursinus TaxID=29139 RepID=A0A4X2K9V5_VOMUR